MIAYVWSNVQHKGRSRGNSDILTDDSEDLLRSFVA